MSDVLAQQLALLPDYLSRHLLLSLSALLIGVGLSLPLAITVTRRRALQGPLLMVVSAIQTIPGLALLALMVPLLGQIGFVPALLALVLYSMLPVIRNTVIGIEDVDPDLVEAGRALGMTGRQILFSVQLPLALPVIIGGIRTAAVWVVGMATLSTPVGATSLGNYIFSGLQTQNYTAVLVGSGAAATLALVLDGGIRVIEVAVARRDRRRLGAAVLVTLALLGAGLSPLLPVFGHTDERPVVTIGTKTFTEQYLLARYLAEELGARGYATDTIESLGSTVVFDALLAGRIDCYVDYTGTIWANHMGRTDNPGAAAVLAGVRRWLRERHGIRQVVPLGFQNAYALAMKRRRAAALGIRTIDDLVAHAPGLRIGADYEFFERPEWRGLATQYGLEFRQRRSMDSTLMYAAVAEDEVDVIAAFSTDGRIPAFDLILLEDPRRALPPYDAVVLVGAAADDTAPGVAAALATLAGAISDDAMRRANRRVDVDGATVSEAAAVLRVPARSGGPD